MKEPTSKYNIIGKRTPMVSSRDKVTGRAQYTDDIALSQPLYVAILRSPHASAKILEIDMASAQAVPGVKAIITGADFNKTFGVLPISRDEPAIAKERVRYVGEPVAAVAAETILQAENALKAIHVSYEVTPASLTQTESAKASEIRLHPELKKDTNVHKIAKQEFGNLIQGFAEAGAVVEESFEFAPVTHAFTEPHATQVEIDSEDNLKVISATQVPHYLHRALSEVLEIPAHHIRVIKPHLGGGFGGKSDPFPHEMIAAKLALITRRNTKVLFSREEVFLSNHGRHGTELKMKLGLHPEKGVTALATNIGIDGGAYASFGVVTTYYNGVLLQGPYSVPNFSFECKRYYTNKPMCGAMRGHGGVNPRFAAEVLFDMACEKQNLDPCETRLKFIHDPYKTTPNEFRITSCSLKEALSIAMKKTEWKKKHKKLPYGKGIGVAAGFFISGSALPIHWDGDMPQSTVRLTIDYDGAVTVYSGASDIGQGSDTMLAQMVAEVLGLPMSMIKVVSADTRLCPIDFGSYSSRVTFMAGNAARNAAIRMRKLLSQAAAQLLEIKLPESTTSSSLFNFYKQGEQAPKFNEEYLGPNPNYEDGFRFENMLISYKSQDRVNDAKTNQTLGYFDVVKKALAHTGALQTKGIYISPKLGGNFKGAGAGLSPAYSFSSFISEVTVDPETGFVKVDKITAAHDCGYPLNPLAVEGQVEGSIHMALGQALMERMDYQNGAQQNASFLDYKIPSAFEMPEVDIVDIPSFDNEGPFGAKEVGEGALAPVIPSIANAIYDAVGVRLFKLPMTPESILAALERKGQKA